MTQRGVYVVSSDQFVAEDARCIKFENRPDLSSEYQSFFLTYIPCNSSHVSVEQDHRGLDDLITAFPTVDTDQLKRIWSKSQSWVHCMSVLSSLVSQERGIAITSNQLDVLTNEHAWPMLSQELFSESFSSMTLEDRGSWTLCSVASPTESDHSDKDWERVEYPSPREPLQEGEMTADTAAVFIVPSYRDVLLRNESTGPLPFHLSERRHVQDSHIPWRPTIVLHEIRPTPVADNGKRSNVPPPLCMLEHVLDRSLF